PPHSAACPPVAAHRATIRVRVLPPQAPQPSFPAPPHPKPTRSLAVYPAMGLPTVQNSRRRCAARVHHCLHPVFQKQAFRTLSYPSRLIEDWIENVHPCQKHLGSVDRFDPFQKRGTCGPEVSEC